MCVDGVVKEETYRREMKKTSEGASEGGREDGGEEGGSVSFLENPRCVTTQEALNNSHDIDLVT